MQLTIAYLTARKEPKVEWFLDSLRLQGGFMEGVSIIIVDLYGSTKAGIEKALGITATHKAYSNENGFIKVVPPKPCVWQGPHRLTSEDYFAQCNARNTALCLAKTRHIAFVDDLSVLLPGWLEAVHEAVAGSYIMCGAYKKVGNLVVENGKVISFDDLPEGVDNRLKWTKGNKPKWCPGHWAYGCSLAGPVDDFLRVGGYPEALCDGMGYEDTIMGTLMHNAGSHFLYDPRAMTYESMELHSQLPVLKRIDPGVSPDDQSHAAVRAVARLKHHPNFFGVEGIYGLRKRVLAGEPFPIMTVPEHRWFDKKPLREL